MIYSSLAIAWAAIFGFIGIDPIQGYAGCAEAEMVSAKVGTVGWGPVFLGMSAEELDKLEVTQATRRDNDGGYCGRTVSDLVVDGYHARAFLSAIDSSIVMVFVPLDSPCSRDELLSTLKQRVPSLRYTPSRHSPGLQEMDNAKPFYSVVDVEKARVLAEPGVGLWIGYERCFE